MVKYNLTPEKLLREYWEFDVNCGQRFGQYIVNKYTPESEFDSLVYYEPNNGVAYKLILARLTQK